VSRLRQQYRHGFSRIVIALRANVGDIGAANGASACRTG